MRPEEELQRHGRPSNLLTLPGRQGRVPRLVLDILRIPDPDVEKQSDSDENVCT